MPILVTGAAGFIGHHVSKRLLERGEQVIGIDNLNDYYSVELKKARLTELQRSHNGFSFVQVDFSDTVSLNEALKPFDINQVVHLGAQAGVRYSITNPHAYITSNLMGHLNILEYCRHTVGMKHLVYASSSSVYGSNTKLPFSVEDRVDLPISLYAATKKSDELMSEVYSHLYRLPQTGLRFFTVYGPWGRPDMAMWLFTEAIDQGEPVKLFNGGNLRRDFTYIDDIVESIVRLMLHPAAGNPDWSGDDPDPATSRAPWRVFNIGNSEAGEVTRLVDLIEEAVGKKAKRELLPMQPGDVHATFADVTALRNAVGFAPKTPISEGGRSFVSWYRNYKGQGNA